MKLELWITKINKKKLYMFPTLAQIIEEATNKFNIDDLYGLIKEHLENLTVQLQDYFPNECSKSFSLTINPFNTSVSDVPEAAEEEFIDLKKQFWSKIMVWWTATTRVLGKNFPKIRSIIRNCTKESIAVPNNILVWNSIFPASHPKKQVPK